MIDLILHLLLLAVVIYFLAEALPGIYVEGYGTALIVAIVYGLINVTLGIVLKIIGLPLIILTLGLFLIVINSFLLYITDAIFDQFEIEQTSTLFLMALLITLADTILSIIF